jgi:hypothetical protein
MKSNSFAAQLLKETGGYRDVPPTILAGGELGNYFVKTERIVEDGNEFERYGDDAGAMYRHVLVMMERNTKFKDLIYILADEAHKLLGRRENVAVSGGQRRDWLFSAGVAKALEVPAISLYEQEDGKPDRIEVHVNGGRQEYISIKGFHVVHVADLLTEGSSFYKADPVKVKDCREGWIPMLRNAGATIDDALVVVTRLQKGEERLEKLGVTAHSFVAVDEEFLQHHSSNPDQAIAYFKDPSGWSRRYLAEKGALSLLSFFDTDNSKFHRSLRFIERYGAHLMEVGRWNELREAVAAKYGVKIDAWKK